MAYTFAIWVRANGLYSARRTITVVTRPDVVTDLRAAASVTAPSFDLGRAQVRLTWRNPAGPLAAIRIVRNTSPTTAGGTVTTLPGSATSFTDTSLPASACGGSATGCSTAPLHYWVVPESTDGGFADRYLRTDVVVGSRTISCTVSGSSSGVVALCCQNLFDAEDTLITGATADPAVDGGAFTIHVPPGVYAVCTFRRQAAREPGGHVLEHRRRRHHGDVVGGGGRPDADHRPAHGDVVLGSAALGPTRRVSRPGRGAPG